MPLALAALGQPHTIKRVGGEVKTHLETLGFVVGAAVTVVSRAGENLIVSIQQTRVALSQETAQKIFL